MKPPKSSQYKGVCFDTVHQKFFAYIKAERQLFLGLFTSEHDAARAYNDKAVELFGDRAVLNIIPDDPPPPSPDEIAATCAAIREGWSDEDYQDRAPHWVGRRAEIDLMPSAFFVEMV